MNRCDQLFNKNIELSDQKIHVFLLQLDTLDYDNCVSFLSEDERNRADKLKVAEKKSQFVLARGSLKRILSNCLNMNVEEILFSYGEHNKPYIDNKYNDRSIEFNISHSGNYALIAVTLDNEIGVDIEKINLDIDFQSLSKRFFSNDEIENIYALDAEKQLDNFYRIWARKESFIKATGKGIAFGLDKFSVLSNKNNFKVDIKGSDKADEQWYCYDLMEVENYKTALTVFGKEKEIISYLQVI